MNKLGGRDQEAELNCVQFLGPKQGMDGLLSWEREEHGRLRRTVQWLLSRTMV